MVNSICLCLTYKCNLLCRHCFASAGPERTEEMSYEQIQAAIDNSFKNVYRMWFSGGEPTVVMDKLLFGLQYAKEKKEKYGFPQKICVQTNGSFAKTKDVALKYLFDFYRHGANELDITSNDIFHFEQMGSYIPIQLAELATSLGIFEKVIVGGSDYKAVKRFGRAKNIPIEELKNFDMKYSQKCVFTGSDYVIEPNGNVIPCIYGNKNILGNIYQDTLEDILHRKENIEIKQMLHCNGIHKILGSQNPNDNFIDICEYCNNYFEIHNKK